LKIILKYVIYYPKRENNDEEKKASQEGPGSTAYFSRNANQAIIKIKI